MSNHPELATLQNYLANSAADEFAGLRLHLAQCASCRELVTGLSGAEQMTQYTAANYSGADGLTEQQHQNIVDYIDNRLAENERLQQKEFIQANAAAMKAALHYASHKTAMDNALSGSATLPAQRANKKNNRDSNVWNILKGLVTIQAPVWLTVPATAALVAVMSINLFNQPESGQTIYTIASYQDNPVIQFRAREAPPGIGFFARPSQSAEPYKPVKVSVSEGNRFTIQWPPVSGAIIYNLRLQMFSQGSKLVLGEVTTKNNSAVITADLDSIYHRYEWVLSGETADNRVFISSGGFVINQAEQGMLK